MANMQYDAFLQWVHAGDSFGNDGFGHYSPAYDSFFPRNCPSPADQNFRRTFGTSPYSLQGNNFIPAWMGYSEMRIRQGTGASILTYNQYQNRLIDGLERRRGTGVFHPRLVTESMNSDTAAKNSTSGLRQNRDTDNEDVARKIVTDEPVDYPDYLLEELGLPLEWTY